jgi:hypothetical protein
MSSDVRNRADARLEEALGRAQLADPRPALRERLRQLKERDETAFEEARRYFEESVLARVGGGEDDPILAWIDYGVMLAELTAGGRVLAVSPDGRASDWSPPYRAGELILYMPHETRTAVTVLASPLVLSAPQQATVDLLV